LFGHGSCSPKKPQRRGYFARRYGFGRSILAVRLEQVS
jgi:hypothetical protein